MVSPLEALNDYYERMLGWTSSSPHLGLPGAAPGSATEDMLPAPGVIAEINSKTRDPHVIGVEIVDDAGRRRLAPLLCPTPWRQGHDITHELVRAGVHPRDIKVITMVATADGPIVEHVRDAVEWLFWTIRDQVALEAEIHEQ